MRPTLDLNDIKPVISRTEDPYSFTRDASIAMARALGGEAGVAPAMLGKLIDAVGQLTGADGRVDTLIAAVRLAMTSC